MFANCYNAVVIMSHACHVSLRFTNDLEAYASESLENRKHVFPVHIICDK